MEKEELVKLNNELCRPWSENFEYWERYHARVYGCIDKGATSLMDLVVQLDYTGLDWDWLEGYWEKRVAQNILKQDAYEREKICKVYRLTRIGRLLPDDLIQEIIKWVYLDQIVRK